MVCFVDLLKTNFHITNRTVNLPNRAIATKGRQKCPTEQTEPN